MASQYLQHTLMPRHYAVRRSPSTRSYIPVPAHSRVMASLLNESNVGALIPREMAEVDRNAVNYLRRMEGLRFERAASRRFGAIVRDPSCS